MDGEQKALLDVREDPELMEVLNSIKRMLLDIEVILGDIKIEIEARR